MSSWCPYFTSTLREMICGRQNRPQYTLCIKKINFNQKVVSDKSIFFIEKRLLGDDFPSPVYQVSKLNNRVWPFLLTFFF